MASLTERQQTIKDMLIEQQLTAPEVAEQLGVSRNAVYQQIKVLRDKKALPAGWTPSGETRVPAGETRRTQSVMEELTRDLKVRSLPVDTPVHADASIDVIASLVEMNKALIAANERLTQVIENITTATRSG